MFNLVVTPGRHSIPPPGTGRPRDQAVRGTYRSPGLSRLCRKSWGLEEHLYRHSNCNSQTELENETEVFGNMRSRSSVAQLAAGECKASTRHSFIQARNQSVCHGHCSLSVTLPVTEGRNLFFPS